MIQVKEKNVALLFLLEDGHKPIVMLAEREGKKIMCAWRNGQLNGVFGNVDDVGPWLIDPKRIVAIQMFDADQVTGQMGGQQAGFPVNRLPPGASGL